jgi:hypothetical protein
VRFATSSSCGWGAGCGAARRVHRHFVPARRSTRWPPKAEKWPPRTNLRGRASLHGCSGFLTFPKQKMNTTNADIMDVAIDDWVAIASTDFADQEPVEGASLSQT